MDINTMLNEADIKLESILSEMNISSIEDYTIGSVTGCDLVEFYKILIESTIGKTIVVTGDEISDGKYIINFFMSNKELYSNVSKGWFGIQDIKNLILEILYYYFTDFDGNTTTKSQKDNYYNKDSHCTYEEVFAIIMMEHKELFRIELYREKSDAIESFENWIELSYEDYINGYPIEDIFQGSRIVKLPIIS